MSPGACGLALADRNEADGLARQVFVGDGSAIAGKLQMVRRLHRRTFRLGVYGLNGTQAAGEVTNTTREMAGFFSNFAVAENSQPSWVDLENLFYVDPFHDNGFRRHTSTASPNNFCVTDARRAAAHGCTSSYSG